MTDTPRIVNQWWKLGGLAGVVYVVLFVVAVVLEGDTPMAGDKASEIKDYFSGKGDTFIFGEWLIAVGFVFFFLPFVSAVRSFLGQAEGQSFVWARLTFAAGVIMTAIGGAASGAQGALAYGAVDYADDQLVRTLVAMQYYVFTVAFGLLVGLLILSASIVILRTGALWKWLGGLGVLIAIASVISSLAVLDEDPEGPLGILNLIVFIAFGVWILATSAGLLMKDALPEPAA